MAFSSYLLTFDPGTNVTLSTALPHVKSWPGRVLLTLKAQNLTIQELTLYRPDWFPAPNSYTIPSTTVTYTSPCQLVLKENVNAMKLVYTSSGYWSMLMQCNTIGVPAPW